MKYFFSIAKEFCKKHGYGYVKSSETELTFTIPGIETPINMK